MAKSETNSLELMKPNELDQENSEKWKKDLNLADNEEVSWIDPAVNRKRRIVNDSAREVKTMNQLNSKSKRLS
jgi:hypothetical protein